MLDKRYEAIIAKPTASDKGTNIDRGAPCMKNAETNTARMQTMARNRGIAVWALPKRTARAIEGARPIWLWMFSISTVASSTRMPTASASPPRVIKLMVCPLSQSATMAAISARGIFRRTTIALRQSRKNTNTIRPTSTAPDAPSPTTPQIARVT